MYYEPSHMLLVIALPVHFYQFKRQDVYSCSGELLMVFHSYFIDLQHGDRTCPQEIIFQ